MRIGQLAQAAGVSTDTIRYYEKIGLLQPPQRTESGYRDYPPGASNRIRVIRNAVQLGFPLDEVSKVLRIRDSGGAPCRQVRDYASQLVAEMDRRIAELHSQRESMLALVQAWDHKLQQARGNRAHLLEDTAVPVRATPPKSTRLRNRM